MKAPSPGSRRRSLAKTWRATYGEVGWASIPLLGPERIAGFRRLIPSERQDDVAYVGDRRPLTLKKVLQKRGESAASAHDRGHDGAQPRAPFAAQPHLQLQTVCGVL